MVEQPGSLLTFLFAESIGPGPWNSVNYKVKVLSCIVYECTPGMYVLAPAFYLSRPYEWVC